MTKLDGGQVGLAIVVEVRQPDAVGIRVIGIQKGQTVESAASAASTRGRPSLFRSTTVTAVGLPLFSGGIDNAGPILSVRIRDFRCRRGS